MKTEKKAPQEAQTKTEKKTSQEAQTKTEKKTQHALKIVNGYYDLENPTEDDDFRYTEALGFLIDTTKEPKYMYNLGWFYCSKKRFDLELKYLEMAAECGYTPAMEELGYMWYYGQHGEKD